MKDLVNACLSLTSLSHLAARESGKRVLLAEYTVARKAVSDLSLVLLFVLFNLVLFCETGLLCVYWLPWNLPCRPFWPQTRRDPSASASQVLCLQASATMPRRLFS